MIKTFALVVGCAAFLALPAVAYADAADDQFINVVRAQDIGGDRDALIGFAHQFCDMAPSIGVVGLTWNLQATQGLTGAQGYSVKEAAINAYCPDKAYTMAPSGPPYNSGPIGPGNPQYCILNPTSAVC